MAPADPPFQPPQWSEHGWKHHPRYNEPWSRVVKETGKNPQSNARYHPSLTLLAIEELEMSVFGEAGEVDQEAGWNEILPRSRSNVRMFWREFTELEHSVGASRGVETKFVLVKYDMSGTLHGHPITRNELIRKGAEL